jgi:hypothetical protein
MAGAMRVNTVSIFWIKDGGNKFLRKAGSKVHGVASQKAAIVTTLHAFRNILAKELTLWVE